MWVPSVGGYLTGNVEVGQPEAHGKARENPSEKTLDRINISCGISTHDSFALIVGRDESTDVIQPLRILSTNVLRLKMNFCFDLKITELAIKKIFSRERNYF